MKFLVEKHVTSDYSIEIEAETEEEAQDKAQAIPLDEWSDDGGDSFWEVNEIE